MKRKEESCIGSIIGGSFVEGFSMRVAHTKDLTSLKTGKFVSICSENSTFFCLIADVALAVSDPDILLFSPSIEEYLLKKVLEKRSMYATALLRPLMMIDASGASSAVKTIPHHFSLVYHATKEDITTIFGSTEHPSGNYFAIGTPVDMDAEVCLNLQSFAERSSGIFGKTGTGKTFITRLLLAGLIKQKKAAVIIFDMHSEYGFQARQEGNTHAFVKGLKGLFTHSISIFSLDPTATRRRGGTPDVELKIPYSFLQVEDVMSLQEELNLHSTAVEAAYLLYARYKKEWLTTLFEQGSDAKELAHAIGAHPESIAALYRKLKRLERFAFLEKTAASCTVIDIMMEYLSKNVSIIIEFGNYSSSLCYLLIANIITRRIHNQYIERTERFLSTQSKADEPIQLLICIEEAHKFLNPLAARQTIFGTIAREMRKYYVSLLLIDQRPSSIDPEIISQIGTKIIAQLSDERDIQAVLSGMAHASMLRTIVGSLDTKKQILLVGHAVAMPIVVRSREYNQEFYQAMSHHTPFLEVTKSIEDLFGSL